MCWLRENEPDLFKRIRYVFFEKDYIRYLMEGDSSLHSVRKVKYRLIYREQRMEIDVYPFDSEKAVLFMYTEGEALLPPEICVLRDVTGDPAYKNRQLARAQKL